MKKIAAVILFACLFFTIVGYHFVFRLQLGEIKAEMKEKLRNYADENVVEFSFNADDAKKIKWEEDHEFRFNNEMYDVIKKHQQGDQLIIRCIPDKKEKALLEAYQKITPDNSGSSAKTSLIKLITAPFLPSQNITVLKPQKTEQPVFFNYRFYLPRMQCSVPERPPIAC
ncbi:MAG: hypothetical protein ACTHMD_11355 [Flavisolibacter sp.]